MTSIDEGVNSAPEVVQPPASTDIVRERILHVLSIYPRLSHSMLQVGIGTAWPPAVWRPVFDQLEADGIVEVDMIPAQTPNGRQQVYNVIHLKAAPAPISNLTSNPTSNLAPTPTTNS